MKERNTKPRIKVGEFTVIFNNSLLDCFENDGRFLSYILCPTDQKNRFTLFFARNHQPPSHEGLFECAQEYGNYKTPVAGGTFDLFTLDYRDSNSFGGIKNPRLKEEVADRLLNYFDF